MKHNNKFKSLYKSIRVYKITNNSKYNIFNYILRIKTCVHNFI